MSNLPLFEVIVHGFLICIVSIIGLLGNIICLAVLSKDAMRNSINCLLMGVAIIDLVLITSAGVLFSLPTLETFLVEHHGVSYGWLDLYRFTPLVYPMAMTAQTASVYLTVAIAFERYIVVCRPFLSRQVCTLGRSQRCVVAIIICSLLYNITRFFEYELVQDTVDWDGNTTLVYLRSSEMRENPLYVKIYINWMYMVFMYMLPFSILLFLNLRIGWELRRARLARIHMTSAQKNEEGCAIMLIIVVMIFMLFNAPAMVSNIIEAFGFEAVELTQVSNLLVVVNSSVNIFVYNIFSRKFRQICFGLLTCGRNPPLSRVPSGQDPGRNDPKTSLRRLAKLQTLNAHDVIARAQISTSSASKDNYVQSVSVETIGTGTQSYRGVLTRLSSYSI
ncbi:hypothetical protein TCAL_06951 [Tigriopus californicus]|uniref:G-protein coupled receptors family 1 profile domain-containing protein n=1 Tax=Tigriopus californicus TaxID=6832 RepID=A0A553PI65_TIGCA|nr:FMRFamide receptor-like [Tigriopus californicus]TRY77365.1 hypothetical protein TCAL_06951 [Tigriopus californicus]|eukprot:TCALIF_06951-PA protein Name:"Similar to FR FMRFamide receptor (Drosophila melanogaster)" AED:0.07 eAED:0.07 QI:0/-1/0/1/-1/1/1/0/390